MAKTESITELTERVGGIKNQRQLAKELSAATEAGLPKPHIAAIESRISARAKEVKAAQRRAPARPLAADPATGKRAGQPAPQNSIPIAPGSFGKEGAVPLNQRFMDQGAQGDFKVAFGDDKSLIRNIDPLALTSVLPTGESLVNGSAIELDTTGLPARVEVTYVYLLDGDKPFGRCELAAPLPLAPGEKVQFRPGTLVFRS